MNEKRAFKVVWNEKVHRWDAIDIMTEQIIGYTHNQSPDPLIDKIEAEHNFKFYPTKIKGDV